MKHFRPWIVLTLALGLGLFGYVTAHAGHALLASPTAEAVADIQKIYEGLDQKQKLDMDLQTRRDAVKAADSDRDQEIKRLSSDLELLVTGSPDYLSRRDSLELKALERRLLLAYEQSKMTREARVETDNIYNKIIDAIGRVAEEQGYDLVLTPSNRLQIPTGKTQNPTQNITLRQVLWHNGKNDLTDQVIQLLNNEFNNLAP